jgi:hypothetical protein
MLLLLVFCLRIRLGIERALGAIKACRPFLALEDNAILGHPVARLMVNRGKLTDLSWTASKKG